MYNSFGGKNKITELFIIIIIIISCFFLGQLLSLLLSEILAPGLTNKLELLNTKNRYEINILKLIQAISSTFTFIIPSIVIGKLFGSSSGSYLKLNTSPGFLYYIFIPLFLIAITPALNIVILWNESLKLPEMFSSLEQSMRNMQDSSDRTTELIISGNTTFDLIFSIIVIAIIPAIGEELLFRGVIQQQLTVIFKNIHIAIFVSAFVFSAIHFQFYGFIPRLILGMIFGYLLYCSGSILPSIFAHFFNNLSALIAFSLTGTQNSSVNNFGTNPQDIYFVFAGLFLAILLGKYLFTKKTTN